MTAPSNTPDRDSRQSDDQCVTDESAPEDSTWGVGSASAMQNLVKREQRHARNNGGRSASERPGGD